MHASSVSTVLIICLVLFAMFRRVRRNIGWQPLQPRRLTVRAIIFLIVGVLLLIAEAFNPISLVSDLVGIVLGILLAYSSARMTTYEDRGGQLHYRPNGWMGSLVTALFLGRLAYRFYEVYALSQSGALQQPAGQKGGFGSSGQSAAYSLGDPWTAGLILIMFAYYVAYYWALLRKNRELAAPEPTDS